MITDDYKKAVETEQEAPVKEGFNFKDALKGLPSFKELLGGALSGAMGTVSGSQTGEEAKKAAVKAWFKENMWKIIAGLLGFAIVVRELFRRR